MQPNAPEKPDRRHTFPWGPIRVVAALFAAHMAIVLALVGGNRDFMRYRDLGGLVSGHVTEQPWRLLTSLFIHADPAHVFWNGVSMLVFAVPVILDVGYVGAALVYLIGGVVGGITGTMARPEGVVLFGSSGAVSADVADLTFNIVVKPSTFEKCVRCWHHREDVGTHTEHPEICERCIDNVCGDGESRRFV